LKKLSNTYSHQGQTGLNGGRRQTPQFTTEFPSQTPAQSSTAVPSQTPAQSRTAVPPHSPLQSTVARHGGEHVYISGQVPLTTHELGTLQSARVLVQNPTQSKQHPASACTELIDKRKMTKAVKLINNNFIKPHFLVLIWS